MRTQVGLCLRWTVVCLVVSPWVFGLRAQTFADSMERERLAQQRKLHRMQQMSLAGLEQLSANKDSDASTEIARRYETGAKGLKKSLATSAIWYAKAGEQGDCEGTVKAAELYWFADPVSGGTKFEDWIHVVPLLRQGFADGCAVRLGYYLGEVYRLGLGVPKDFMQARAYYKVAAQKAEFNGEVYDPRAAARLEEMAASGEDPLLLVGSLSQAQAAQNVQAQVAQWSSVSYQGQRRVSDVGPGVYGPVVTWQATAQTSAAAPCKLALHADDSSATNGAADADASFDVGRMSTSVALHESAQGTPSPAVYEVRLSDGVKRFAIPFYEVEQAMLVHKEMLRWSQLCSPPSSAAPALAATPASSAGLGAKKMAGCHATNSGAQQLKLVSTPITVQLTSAKLYAAGDFNGDGKVDLAVIQPDGSSQSLTLLLGDGLGGFTPVAGPLKFFDNDPEQVTIGDFNGDGKLDIAIVNKRYVQHFCIMCPMQPPPSFRATQPKEDGVVEKRAVTVLLGNGDGTFTAAPSATVVNGQDFLITIPAPSQAMDFNGDGKVDELVMEARQANVLLGNGDGTFARVVTTSLPFSPNAFAVGDFNGDGKPDLVLFDQPSGSATVMLGNGDGTFTETTAYLETGVINAASANGNRQSVTSAEIDGDGKLDVVAFTDHGVVSLLSNGDGTFKVVKTASAGHTEPWWYMAADFNGDGKVDVLEFQTFTTDLNGKKTAPSELLLRVGSGDGTFLTNASLAMPDEVLPGPVVAGDFRSDGTVQVVAEQDTYSGHPVVSFSLLSLEGVGECK